jgi:hypothetical protein
LFVLLFPPFLFPPLAVRNVSFDSPGARTPQSSLLPIYQSFLIFKNIFSIVVDRLQDIRFAVFSPHLTQQSSGVLFPSEKQILFLLRFAPYSWTSLFYSTVTKRGIDLVAIHSFSFFFQ